MISDFISTRSKLLLNPKMGLQRENEIQHLFENEMVFERFENHFFIASSGTSLKSNDDLKLVALSKKAILISAKAVNDHLRASTSDIWLNSLPGFHVGGLGIFARAHLTDSKVVLLDKWDPKTFHERITTKNVTLTSLVPTQVFDLVHHQLQAPKSLRSVIVGGGALNPQLYARALSLGWPLLVSYGLTEMASQVATSLHNCQKLGFLGHVEARLSPDGFLMVKSPALLTAYIQINKNSMNVIDPKVNGWFTTEDLVTHDGDGLTILGRSTDFIKIGGEGVYFSNLEKRFEEIKLMHKSNFDSAIVAVPDNRLGHVIHLATTESNTLNLVEEFNASVMPYERIRQVHLVDQIPRTALHKLCKQELLQIINNR